MTISEQVVKAMPERIYAAKKTEGSNCVVSFDTPSLDYNVEYVRADLVPFLPVQGAVKKLEWTKGVVDIASPHPGMKYVACSTTPKGSWAFWLDHAPETRSVFTSEEAAKAAAQADYSARILSALEPSAGRAAVVEEAARVADGWADNSKSASENKKTPIQDRIAHSVAEDAIRDVAKNIRALASHPVADKPDEAGAQGEGWLPIESAPKDGTVILVYREDAGVFTAHYVEEDAHLSSIMNPPEGDFYWFSTAGDDLTNDMPTHWRPLPSAPSEGAE